MGIGIVKRTPLYRTQPLRRGSSMLKRSRLQAVSPKRRNLNAARSRFVKNELNNRVRCEAGIIIHRATDKQWISCQGNAVELHEPLTRARGGSIVDPTNTVAICRACHDWVHTNPKTAQTIGLLESQYG